MGTFELYQSEEHALIGMNVRWWQHPDLDPNDLPVLRMQGRPRVTHVSLVDGGGLSLGSNVTISTYRRLEVADDRVVRGRGGDVHFRERTRFVYVLESGPPIEDEPIDSGHARQSWGPSPLERVGHVMRDFDRASRVAGLRADRLIVDDPHMPPDAAIPPGHVKMSDDQCEVFADLLEGKGRATLAALWRTKARVLRGERTAVASVTTRQLVLDHIRGEHLHNHTDWLLTHPALVDAARELLEEDGRLDVHLNPRLDAAEMEFLRRSLDRLTAGEWFADLDAGVPYFRLES